MFHDKSLKSLCYLLAYKPKWPKNIKIEKKKKKKKIKKKKKKLKKKKKKKKKKKSKEGYLLFMIYKDMHSWSTFELKSNCGYNPGYNLYDFTYFWRGT